jgi:hypothetical protein
MKVTTKAKCRGLRWAAFPLIVATVASPLCAQGPNLPPRQEGTIKAAIGLPADFFARPLREVEARRADWLRTAAAATPALKRAPRPPVRLVKVEKDAGSFQGWKAVPAGEVASAYDRPLVPGDGFILDFGEHFTGYVTLGLRAFAIPIDAPVRLSLIFGEVPAEVAEHDALYMGVAPFTSKEDNTPYRAIRTSRYTYVRRPAGPWMLFDDQADPHQLDNLVGQPAHVALVREMDQRLSAALRAARDDFQSPEYYVRKFSYELAPHGSVSYQPGARVQSPRIVASP